MNLRILPLCLLLSLTICKASAAPFSNGDFELPVLSVPDNLDVTGSEVNGWTKTGPGRLVLLHNVANNFVAPKSGAQQLMFNSGNAAVGAVISRTIPTVVGKQYQVQFYVGRAGTSGGDMGITPSVHDSSANLLYSSRFQAPSTQTYGSASQFIFTATTTSSVLAFEDTSLTTNAVDVLLDAVTVTPTVFISSQPQSTEVRVTESINLSVTAEGIGSLSYQWRKDGENLVNETASALHIVSSTVLHAGKYDVVVTDANGSMTSSEAQVSVLSPAVFVDPVSQSGYGSQSSTFSVTAAGTGTLTYQWRKNGVPIAGATASTLSIQPLRYVDEGEYHVAITDDVDSTTSAAATLTVVMVGIQNTHGAGTAIPLLSH